MSRRPARTLVLAGCLAALAPAGCATPAPAPAATMPAPPLPAAVPPAAATLPAPAPAPGGPWSILAPCLGKDRSPAALRRGMDRAFDHRDARCWSAREIELARALLAAAEKGHRGGGPVDGDVLQRAAWHFRQAEIRANRFGFDEIAAVADLGRAEVAMAAGDGKATVFHLGRAVRAAERGAAATGVARKALDGIFVTCAVEALAEEERTGDRADLDVALAAVTRLQGREALRAFHALGVTPARLAAAADLPDAAKRLRAFAKETRALQGDWGPAERKAAPAREQTAEAVVQSGPAWIAAAPTLLDWLPGDVPEIGGGVEAVLAKGEVFLDYAVGAKYGVVFVITQGAVDPSPLPGRARLAKDLAACPRGDAVAGASKPAADPCARLRSDLLGPAAAALPASTQVLVAADGILHRAPFEALLAGRSVVRVPSALGLTGLRLRVFDQGPKAHPAAASLVPAAEAAKPPAKAPAPGASKDADADPTVAGGPAPGALAPLRAALAAGAPEVIWTAKAAPERRYGTPVTVP